MVMMVVMMMRLLFYDSHYYDNIITPFLFLFATVKDHISYIS